MLPLFRAVIANKCNLLKYIYRNSNLHRKAYIIPHMAYHRPGMIIGIVLMLFNRPFARFEYSPPFIVINVNNLLDLLLVQARSAQRESMQNKDSMIRKQKEKSKDQLI